MTPYYQDSHVTIYHRDCFDVMCNLSGIGAVITDPPYSSGGAFRGDRMLRTLDKYVSTDSAARAHLPQFSGDNRDQRSFIMWCTLWMTAARVASVPGAVLCAFSDWRQVPAMTDAVQCGGWVWRGIETWWKPGVRMQRGMFSGSSEFVVFATNGPHLDHGGCPQSVFRCGIVKEREHIAEKPIEVMGWIAEVIPPGSLVVDPFMGSGTTLVVAKARGMAAVGIDCDEASCEIAARRMSQEVLDLRTDATAHSTEPSTEGNRE